LLTERSADLTDYPGQLSFPGGAVDAQDDGPVATALREAVEEVGLDPESVHVIGLLPPQALPDTGFLVDPVLAWSNRPTTSRSVNYAEVAATCQVPLRELALRKNGSRSAHVGDSSAAETGPDLGTLGRMTSTIVDQLLAMLAPTSIGHAEGQSRSADLTTPAGTAPRVR
jgi:8-oxo-dGTP pyrophosphatase MutT (NUDIX family)